MKSQQARMCLCDSPMLPGKHESSVGLSSITNPKPRGNMLQYIKVYHWSWMHTVLPRIIWVVVKALAKLTNCMKYSISALLVLALSSGKNGRAVVGTATTAAWPVWEESCMHKYVMIWSQQAGVYVSLWFSNAALLTSHTVCDLICCANFPETN